MKKLSTMVGSWKGRGWMRKGPGEPYQMRSTEKVEYRLDGRILVVQGRHWDQDDPEKVVHHAFAVISYDSKTGQYRFRSYLANGRAGDHEMRLDGDDILWFIETPQGEVRYTIQIKDEKWHEIGEHSTDGENWRQFFQMDLKAASETGPGK